MSKQIRSAIFMVCCLPLVAHAAEDNETSNHKVLLWGDTHLHTNNSFDAFLNDNRSVTPEDAYRFAKGEPVVHAYTKTRVQITTPLDFLVVTDHAEFLGGMKDIYFKGIDLKDPNIIERLVIWYREREIRNAIDSGQGQTYFSDVLPKPGNPRVLAESWVDELPPAIPGAEASLVNAWHELLKTADRYNEPGQFTAFSGWEWSSQPGAANLHRVVISDANKTTGKNFLPFASTDSPFPEDLWRWLEKTEQASGVRFLAIPHNSNVSKGVMFDTKTLRGENIDIDYAERRLRYEPIVEVTQIKGDSETHESLSPGDEFAMFETYTHLLASSGEISKVEKGDYVRSALKTGLQLEQSIGVNPFKLGMIGSTDSHTGFSTAEEPNFWGKFARDSIPKNKSEGALGGASGWAMSASGLAAVWAKENTRDSILDAMFRREVYATTGARIWVRFFGAWDFTEADLSLAPNVVYSKGVPMGGSLEGAPSSTPPSFLVQAGRDPQGENLDRIQIVKGWVDSKGEAQEHIYNVAWSDKRVLDSEGKLDPIADNVNRKTGRTEGESGAASLVAVWHDPDFNPDQAAFYYARVLQIPSARHSLLDRIALGQDNALDYPDVIQERAYTSPIWYVPTVE